MRGKFSEISMPGTFVLIGLYGPRISAGALGFMSQVSSCEGPPTRNSMMQFVSFCASTAPSAFSPRNWVRPRPRNESEPACRKSRRRRPSQNSTGLSASRRNIRAHLPYHSAGKILSYDARPSCQQQPSASRGYQGFFRGFHRRHAHYGQAKAKTGAPAGRRLGPHVAAMIEYRLARKCKSESKAVLFAGGDEGLEQPVANLRRDARPGIGNRDRHRAVLRRGRTANDAAIRHGIERVIDQVEEYA